MRFVFMLFATLISLNTLASELPSSGSRADQRDIPGSTVCIGDFYMNGISSMKIDIVRVEAVTEVLRVRLYDGSFISGAQSGQWVFEFKPKRQAAIFDGEYFEGNNLTDRNSSVQFRLIKDRPDNSFFWWFSPMFEKGVRGFSLNCRKAR